MGSRNRTLMYWVEIQSTATIELGLNGSDQAPTQIVAQY